MKKKIITYIEVAKVHFDKGYSKGKIWWYSLTSKQQNNICGTGIIVGIVLCLVIAWSSLTWVMDRSVYIGDKHAYEDYLDKAPEMPRFREKYRIVKYSDRDFVIQTRSDNQWLTGDFDKWWSLSYARSSMWSKIETDAENWIHANALEIGEVIE